MGHDGHGSLLDTIAALAAERVAQLGVALRAPVIARLRTAEDGATGVELHVRVADPAKADAARATLRERFGGGRAPDRIDVQ